MLLGLASLQKENTLNEAASKQLNMIILPATIMDSISFIKYPFHKNNRCSEGILKEKKKKVTMKSREVESQHFVQVYEVLLSFFYKTNFF